MDVTVRAVAGDAEEELRSLRDWLAAEDEFRGRLALNEAAPRSNEMGGVIELLTVAVGGGGAATVLAGSISAWLRTRRSDMTIEIIDSEQQRSVKVSVDRVADPEAIIRDLLGHKES